MRFAIWSLYLAFQDFSYFFKHSFQCKNGLLKRVSFLFILVIRGDNNFLSVISDLQFFPFVLTELQIPLNSPRSTTSFARLCRHDGMIRKAVVMYGNREYCSDVQTIILVTSHRRTYDFCKSFILVFNQQNSFHFVLTTQ